MLIMEDIHLLVLITPFPVIAFINDKATGCINEEVMMLSMKQAQVLPMQEEIHLLVFFISCFTFSLAPSINKPEFSSDSTILIISSKSSFNINKVSPPPALRGPYLLIFLSNLSNIDEVAFVAKLAKTFLSKGTATSISTFLTKLPFILPNALARNPPDWIF